LQMIGVRVALRGAFVAAGRFEPSEQPYRGIGHAFGGLIEQLLTLGDEQLLRWRRRFREALGPLAGVVASMVPGLELVLGESPGVPVLELAESRNRLHVAFARFWSVLAREGPLILVLDDLQWADRGSLDLLRAMLVEGSESAALLIGAHQSEALDDGHPLTELFDALTRAGRPITRLRLQPLSHEQLEHLLADVLRRQRRALASLVELVARKTGGNPLYLRSFLFELAARGHLRVGPKGWEWDTEAIAAAPVPDDALAIMRAKLKALPSTPAQLLEIAACIGPRFDVALLEAIAELQAEAFAAGLHVLEREGLIVPSETDYVFCNARVRDSVIELLPTDRHRALRWALARRRLQSPTGTLDDEHLFELVEHVDVGLAAADAIEDPLRHELVRLYVAAGQRALASAAWAGARRYFERATALLEPARDADQQHELEFAAAFGLAQALALTDATREADAGFEALLERRLSLLERSLVTTRRVRILQMHERMHDAYEYARAGLRQLGVHMPARVSLPRMLLMLARALLEARRWPLERMLSVPAATDERLVAALHLMQVIKGPAYIVQPELGAYTAAAHALALMRAGHHPTTPEGYATMAFVLATLGRTETAWQRCNDVAILADRREATLQSQLAPQVMRLALGSLCRPHREMLPGLEQLHARALEIGERAVAGYIVGTGMTLHLEAGTHLRELVELAARLHAADESHGSREMATLAEYNRRAIARFLGGDVQVEFMTVDELGDEEISTATKLSIRATEIWGRLLLGEHEGQWERTLPLRGFGRALIGSAIKTRVAATLAIVCSEHGFELGGRERRRSLRSLRGYLGIARQASKGCRENFQPYVDLIRGEIAALRGRDSALRWFELSRGGAFESGTYHLAALASLRLSRWAGRAGLPVIEAEALRFARSAFERWGAWAIVERLDRVKPSVELDALSGPSTTTSVRSSGSSADSGRALDVATLLGTMQAISEDLRLEEVITRVLGSAIESAGADRGALLLARGDDHALVAEGHDRAVRSLESEAPAGPAALDVRYLQEGVRLRDARDRLPCTVVNYALRTGAVVLDDVAADPRFAGDPYVREGARSLLCMPIHKQSENVGVLVLENRLVAGAFTTARLQLLRALMGQAASALDNARLYGALSRSEAQWRSLVDAAPDMITQIDADGRVEFVNHGWPGLDAREQIGEPGDLHMDPDSRAAWRAALAAVVETGKPRELELAHDLDGRKRWTMTRLAAIQSDSSGQVRPGEVRKVLSIATDITERKALESQLRQQQRLESIGTLASGIAHEINNPIQGILNYSELISLQPEDLDTVREYSAEIGRESQRVATIVRDLLAFSRRDTSQPIERMQLHGLVASTLSLVGALLRRDKIAIEVEVPADLPEIDARPQQIRQILMNLITNARDATVSTGEASSEPPRVIAIRGQTSTRAGVVWVRLSVQDHGIGMSEEVRAQAFDPFFTTKGRDQGTGLGLAVSHGIAQEHGGELSFETELGRGTTFHLDLPAAPT
jgi:PAS domain S-box-containing protein